MIEQLLSLPPIGANLQCSTRQLRNPSCFSVNSTNIFQSFVQFCFICILITNSVIVRPIPCPITTGCYSVFDIQPSLFLIWSPQIERLFQNSSRTFWYFLWSYSHNRCTTTLWWTAYIIAGASPLTWTSISRDLEAARFFWGNWGICKISQNDTICIHNLDAWCCFTKGTSWI